MSNCKIKKFIIAAFATTCIFASACGSKNTSNEQADSQQNTTFEQQDQANQQSTLKQLSQVNQQSMPNQSSQAEQQSMPGQANQQNMPNQPSQANQQSMPNQTDSQNEMSQQTNTTKQQSTENDFLNDETTPEVETDKSINNKSGKVIAIDAGHQARGNSEKEPIGPGADEVKAKVAGGTSGVSTGIPEYELTLAVSLKLRDILEERGYDVVMIRESNNVDISNSERAEIANAAGADAFIRIHADAAGSESANGMTALCQTPGNPYNGYLYSESRSLCDNLLSSMAAVTGAKVRGVSEVDNMSGINWATVPTAIIEMGFMTNPSEDEKMAQDGYRTLLAEGMADGIDAFLN